MTELERGMESLIKVFHKYAEEDGDKKFLSKKEFKKTTGDRVTLFPQNPEGPKSCGQNHERFGPKQR